MKTVEQWFAEVICNTSLESARKGTAVYAKDWHEGRIETANFISPTDTTRAALNEFRFLLRDYWPRHGVAK